MVRFDTWSVGPSLVWWRINESDRANNAARTFEPRNSTYGVGFKGMYHF